MRRLVIDDTGKDNISTSTVVLLNDANHTRVQKMMRHQHYATTEIYVEEVQRLLEGAEDAVTQI
ncbi:MAG TPA: hypothetical protein PK614_04445 [Nitrospira sp.]|nr:hypothetical protein [Nitrospira sp.]